MKYILALFARAQVSRIRPKDLACHWPESFHLGVLISPVEREILFKSRSMIQARRP